MRGTMLADEIPWHELEKALFLCHVCDVSEKKALNTTIMLSELKSVRRRLTLWLLRTSSARFPANSFQPIAKKWLFFTQETFHAFQGSTSVKSIIAKKMPPPPSAQETSLVKSHFTRDTSFSVLTFSLFSRLLSHWKTTLRVKKITTAFARSLLKPRALFSGKTKRSRGFLVCFCQTHKKVER